MLQILLGASALHFHASDPSFFGRRKSVEKPRNKKSDTLHRSGACKTNPTLRNMCPTNENIAYYPTSYFA